MTVIPDNPVEDALRAETKGVVGRWSGSPVVQQDIPFIRFAFGETKKAYGKTIRLCMFNISYVETIIYPLFLFCNKSFAHI